MPDPKVCMACGRDIEGRPIELRPRDPKYALCRPCGAPSQTTGNIAADASTQRDIGPH